MLLFRCCCWSSYRCCCCSSSNKCCCCCKCSECCKKCVFYDSVSTFDFSLYLKWFFEYVFEKNLDENYIDIVVWKNLYALFFRMGVREMAFGLGMINMKGSDPPEMYYTNLWLPSRWLTFEERFKFSLKKWQTNKKDRNLCYFDLNLSQRCFYIL